jgi:hypothetical protein
MLYTFLTTGRGIAFNRMFAMKEYPQDILPLYSQGYSLARFLIAQGGKRRFVQYVGDGMKSRNWTATTKKHYGYKSLSDLQVTWLDWVRRGCPAIKPESTMVAVNDSQQQDGPDHGTLVRPVSQSTGDAVQIAASVDSERTSGSWYKRQRDLAQDSRATGAKVQPDPHAALHSNGGRADSDTPRMHSSVTRPQPIGTPQQIVIPPTPRPANAYTVPPMVPVPLALPQPVYPTLPTSRY